MRTKLGGRRLSTNLKPEGRRRTHTEYHELHSGHRRPRRQVKAQLVRRRTRGRSREARRERSLPTYPDSREASDRSRVPEVAAAQESNLVGQGKRSAMQEKGKGRRKLAHLVVDAQVSEDLVDVDDGRWSCKRSKRVSMTLLPTVFERSLPIVFDLLRRGGGRWETAKVALPSVFYRAAALSGRSSSRGRRSR